MVFFTENYCRFLTGAPDEVLIGSGTEIHDNPLADVGFPVSDEPEMPVDFSR
jgi:hypothetical protein